MTTHLLLNLATARYIDISLDEVCNDYKQNFLRTKIVIYGSKKFMLFEFCWFQFRNATETKTQEIWVKQWDYLQDLSIRRPERSKIAYVVKDKFRTSYADNSLPDFIHF